MLDQKLLIELQKYLDLHLNSLVFSKMEECVSQEAYSLELQDYIKSKRQPSFNQTLFSFIDKNGAADSEIYKKAGIDRRHFSKIRTNPDYRPSKNTVVALALALQLNKKNTDKLLSAAGYSLSDSDTFDLVIQFCVEKRIYDIHDVNQALDYFSLKPLIGVLA